MEIVELSQNNDREILLNKNEYNPVLYIHMSYIVLKYIALITLFIIDIVYMIQHGIANMWVPTLYFLTLIVNIFLLFFEPTISYDNNNVKKRYFSFFGIPLYTYEYGYDESNNYVNNVKSIFFEFKNILKNGTASYILDIFTLYEALLFIVRHVLVDYYNINELLYFDTHYLVIVVMCFTIALYTMFGWLYLALNFLYHQV